MVGDIILKILTNNFINIFKNIRFKAEAVQFHNIKKIRVMGHSMDKIKISQMVEHIFHITVFNYLLNFIKLCSAEIIQIFIFYIIMPEYQNAREEDRIKIDLYKEFYEK